MGSDEDMDSGMYLDTQDCRNCEDLGRRVNDLKNLLEKSEEIYSALSLENDHLKEMCTSYRISQRNLEKRLVQTEEWGQRLNERYTSLHEKKDKVFHELTKIKQILAVTKSEYGTLAEQNAQLQTELAGKCINAKLFEEMSLVFAQNQMKLSSTASALKTLELEREHYIQYIKDLKAQLDEKENLCSELINYQKNVNQELLNSSDNSDSSNTVSSSVLGEENTLKNELDKCLGGYTLLQVNVSLQTSFLLMDSSTQTAECLCSQCQVLDEESHQHTSFLTTLHVCSVNEMNGSNIDNSTQTEDLPNTQHKERYCSSIYLSALSQDETGLPLREVRTQHLEQGNLTCYCSADKNVVEVESSANYKSLSLYSSSSNDLSVSGTRPSGQEESEGKSVLSSKSFETEACAQESDGDPGSENSAVELHQVLPSPWSPSDGTVSLCNSPRSDKYAKCRYNSSSWNLKLITSSLLAFFTVILLMWMYLKMDAECRKCKESVSCIFRHVNQIFAVRFTYPRGPPPV